MSKGKSFNEDCYKQRPELKKLRSLMCKFPKNAYIRKTHHDTKRNYKSILKKKSVRQQKENQLYKLNNLCDKSIRDKWHMIKSITNDKLELDPCNEVPENEWTKF